MILTISFITFDYEFSVRASLLVLCLECMLGYGDGVECRLQCCKVGFLHYVDKFK